MHQPLDAHFVDSHPVYAKIVPVTSFNITPVILCGGSGNRLWPLSRTGFPKQFLCLTGSDSLFQQAVLRLAALQSPTATVAPPLIVTGEEHRFLAAEQLREINLEWGCALLEPTGRNTAPALTLAALTALENGEDPLLVVTPADQTIPDTTAFVAAMHAALPAAQDGQLVILGIRPHRPETGYGYIQVEAALPGSSLHPVSRFVEKPDAATAAQYLAAGSYFWNAGMCVVRASVWLNALAHFRPQMLDATRHAWEKRTMDGRFIRPGRAEFGAIPSESIDFAVLEACPGSEFSIAMVPLDAGWSDLGAWDAVWQAQNKDDAGNAHFGDVFATGSANTLVHATSRLVGLVGVENLIVIETPDAVMVADHARSQEVKDIVSALQLNGREEHALHRKVHRPWGWYDSIDEGARFKVKRICVHPKASLSLQKHHHRAEHWVVVRGTAEITNGDETILLTENQSTYIPVGQVHRLANPGTIPLEIIEVQSGSYLGEDDIVRFVDDYGRAEG
jgi:mannose-1-phosphate guanylyltransferase / mannose-6-phosphate isomerase